jgi:aldehyde dehydrogenase (NAD+)
MPFLHYSDLDEVIASINNTEKPLAMYIFTNDYSVSERMLRETSAGHAVVNDILLQFCAPIPFGGAFALL